MPATLLPMRPVHSHIRKLANRPEAVSEHPVTEDLFKEEIGAAGTGAGVEFEPYNSIAEPFDPASISIEPRVVPMDAVLRRLRQKTIRLAPSFQRKYVWDSVRQSRLIESLMLRIPLPMFYVAANPDGTWDVVDGLQRLTTIRDFILGNEKDVLDAKAFPLIELEFWGERFDGKQFKDIESDPSNSRIINNILETEMRFTVINPGTPEEVKRNIFKRINTGGMPLTLQEIRHALYQGAATRLLEELVESQSFQNAVDKSIDDSRMAGRELILRFLAFYMFDHENFDGDMDSYLSNAMRTINCMPNVKKAELERIFKSSRTPNLRVHDIATLKQAFNIAMDRSLEFFEAHAFRKGISGQRRTPVNKALFEVWGTILSDLSPEQFTKLMDRRDSVLDSYNRILSKDDFDRAISRDSSSAFGVRERYKSLGDMVEESLKSND